MLVHLCSSTPIYSTIVSLFTRPSATAPRPRHGPAGKGTASATTSWRCSACWPRWPAAASGGCGDAPGGEVRHGGTHRTGAYRIAWCPGWPMSDALPPDGAPPDQSSRLDAVECPFCGGVTMPNLLADGSYICSCPAERALPLPEGTPVLMPP